MQVYLGREPVGNGQAPEGFRADLIPGVAAVDGAAFVTAFATGLLAAFFTAAFTAGFAADFTAGFATAFFTAGLAAAFLTAGFLAADTAFAPVFLALVAIPTSFFDDMNKNYLENHNTSIPTTSIADL